MAGTGERRARRRGRTADRVLSFLALGLVLVVGTVWHARHAQSEATLRLERTREVIRDLGLTDLCLVTEAPYTRHLTRADTFSPFQDVPCGLEHFPAGSTILPPRRVVPWRGPARRIRLEVRR